MKRRGSFRWATTRKDFQDTTQDEDYDFNNHIGVAFVRVVLPRKGKWDRGDILVQLYRQSLLLGLEGWKFSRKPWPVSNRLHRHGAKNAQDMGLVLIGCEESQTICLAFRKLGHEAYSCDLKPCSGGHPEWHLQMDVFEAIKLKPWDLAIFHPECTYLTVSANS